SAVLLLLWPTMFRFSVEGAGRDEGAALVYRHRVTRLGRGLGFDLAAENLRTVLGLEAEMRGQVVVPPDVAIGRHAIDDGMADIRGEEGALQQMGEIAIAEPGGHHSSILRFGKRGADPDAHRLDAVAVEIEAGQRSEERRVGRGGRGSEADGGAKAEG